MRATPLLWLFTWAAVPLGAATARAADVAALERNFEQPPDDARIMVRWWWFGPAVTKPQLEREMRRMKEAGIGGFEVQPTYPLALDGDVPGLVNLKFMSPEFLDCLKFTAAKAKELGLRMDLTLGSGWPYGGPQFSAAEAAGRIQTQNIRAAAGQTSVSVPRLRDGQRLIAAFIPATGDDESNIPYREVEIRDGAVQLPADLDVPTTITFFIAGQTGMQVKRAAFGGEGNVLDHYNPAVVEKFIREIAAPAVEACGDNPPYAVFCDSLEVNGEDWTADFLDQFQRLRGYDLRPYLPALVTDVGPKTLDVRHDWARTLTDLYNENFAAAMAAFAKQHNTRFRIQGYGSPPATLSSYADADLNEGEGFAWHGFDESRWASSASHLMGRPVTSSETWTWLHQAVYLATPLDMKAEANQHFLQGVNQLIGHGWPYTPEEIAYPGNHFYAAGVLNQNNPWWIVMPDVAKHFQRVSSMMRAGRPANDVALYLSNSDAWARFTPGRVSMNATAPGLLGRTTIAQILDSGYNLDFFDDGLLGLRGQAEGGRLAFGEAKYPVVVLAYVERVPPSTLLKLEQFARGGGTLIAVGRTPSLAPGFLATDGDQKTVRETAERLFAGPDAPGILIASESELGATLAKRLPPDVAMDPPSPDVGFVHRTSDAAEICFLANTANVPRRVRATFRVEGMQPEWWDPMTGRISPAEVVARPSSGTTVHVDLPAYGSNLLVFTRRNLPAMTAPNVSPEVPAPVDLSSGWTVTFGDDTLGDAQPVVMETLRSWTDDETTRSFSGVATYEKTITVPAAMLQPGLRVTLDLGDGAPPARGAGGRGGGSGMRAEYEAPVREAAVVYVNGQRAAAVWCPPYAVDLTGLLKPGENRLRIEAANLAANHVAAHPLPDYRRLDAVYGNRFQMQGLNLIRPTTSGLLGPIRLGSTHK